MLQQITTKGETYPLNFGIRTLATTADALGMSLDKMVKQFQMPDMNVGDMIGLIVSVSAVAMTDGARKSGQPRHYSEDDVVDMIDEDETLLSQLVALFRASIGSGQKVFPTAATAKPGE